MIRHLRRAVVAVLGCVALVACTGVPTSGPVVRVSAQPGRLYPGVEIAPAPPDTDATPVAIVEGFLHAMASWQPDYRVARAYLTEAASAAWEPDAGVGVFATDNAVIVNESEARIRGTLTGTLDEAGTYRASAEAFDHEFGLVRDAQGQWRISNPPRGLLVSEQLFGSAFTRISVYYRMAGQSWLVPDARFFPRGEQMLPEAAAAVVGEPSAWLAAAVETPEVRTPFAGVSLGPNGVARVSLARPAQAVDAEHQRALAEQFVWTLRQFDAVGAVELGWAGEGAWVIDGYGTTVPVTAFADADPAARQTSRQLFGVAEGQVVRLSEGSTAAGALVVSPGIADAQAAAVRPDALGVAAVGGNGTTLTLAPLGESTTEVVFTGEGLVRPHWSRLGELWLADGAGQLWVLPVDGDWTRVSVDGLAAGARVRAVRVSPDAARIALVVETASGGRTIGVAWLERSDDGLVAAGFRPLSLSPSTASPLDVGWSGEDTLLVLVSNDTARSVLRVTSDGASLSAIGPVEVRDFVELAVAPGVAAMVRTADGEVWQYGGDFRWSPFATGVTGISYAG